MEKNDYIHPNAPAGGGGPGAFRSAGPLGTNPSMDKWMYPGPLGSVCSLPPPREWHQYSRQGGFPASMLALSPEAVALLQAIETLRLKPYDDQAAKDIDTWVKGATIGYGHLIKKHEWDTYKDGITQEQAEALFQADAAPFITTVGDSIMVGVQQYEFDAMVILAFNIGETGFRNSSVVKLINKPMAGSNYAALELHGNHGTSHRESPARAWTIVVQQNGESTRMQTMRAGENQVRRDLLRVAAALSFAVLAASASGIDNPDAPDRVAAFESRAAPLELQLAATDGGSAATRAGKMYADFLDTELNTAYRTLLMKLRGPARVTLAQSQQQWLRFRDAEYQFIAQHWTRERSGSSASLSVAGYGNAIVKERVLQLLRYTAEYP